MLAGIRRLLPKVLLPLVLPGSLLAQAWLPPTGEGTVYLGYELLSVRNHADWEGVQVDVGHIHTQGLLMDVDYGLSKKLALRMGLPFLTSKYDKFGPTPHLFLDGTTLDNGNYHGSLQDLRFDLRYSLASHPLMLAPFFEAVIPSHPYQIFAHSAIGRDQREYHLGVNAGRRLNPVLPNGYFQVRYSYAFVQRILGISPNRSDTEFSMGYFLTPRFSVLGLASWRYTHQGIDHIALDWIQADPQHGIYPRGLTAEQYYHHDQILKARMLDLGGGAAFAASPSLSIFGSLTHTVRARNGHVLAAGVTVGASWTFRTARSHRTLTASAALPETASATLGAFRCECGKK